MLLACSIPPEVPGDYSITFSVVNSAGLVATVRRSITIKAVCPSGESLCPDKVSTLSATIAGLEIPDVLLRHQFLLFFSSR